MAGVDAGTIYSEVRVALDKLKGDLQQVETQFNKFGTTNTAAATKTEKSWKKSFGQVNLAGVAAFVAIGAAVKQAISVFASFEQSMANVQSVARATPEEFRLLEEAALKAGETTRFTARQAADALYYLASAGYDAKQSTEALSGVLAYAAATQSDLAFASAQVAATISQFSLEASDADRVANVFTATIQRTQANAEKLAEAMKYVGPVANGMGISLEEVSAALGVLYNQGYLGQQAGAALRNIMGDLADETGPTVKRLKDLGITFEKVNPEVNSLADVIEELQTVSLTTGEVISIFGKRSGPIMASLLNQGADAVRDLTSAVTDTNAAAEAMAVQNDTLQGSIDLFNSAVESAAIKTTKELSPALRGIIDLGKQLVEWFANLPGPIKIFVGIATAGIPVVLGLATAFKVLAGALAGSAGIITGVVAAIGAGVAIVSAIAHQANAVALIQESAEAKQNELKDSTDKLKESLENLDKVQKRVKESTKDMTAENKKALEAEEARAQAVAQAALANQLVRIAQIQDDIAKRKDRLIKEEQRYSRELNESGIIARQRYADETEIQSSIYNQTRLRREIIDSLKKSIDDLGKSENEGINVVAEAVKKGQIKLEQIYAFNEALGKQVQAQIEVIKKQEEQAKKEAADAARKEKAAAAAAERERKYNQQVDLVNQTLDAQKTKLDKLREKLAELQTLRLRGKDEVNRQKAIKQVLAEIAEEEEKLKQKTEEKISLADEYKKKIDGLNQSVIDAFKAERAAALASLDDLDKSSLAYLEAKSAINEYYDAIIENEKKNQAQQSLKETWETATTEANKAMSSIAAIVSAVADARIADIDRQLQAELEAAGVAEETAIERIQREIEEAKRAGDAETVLEKQKELEREKITQKYEREKARIQYQSALAQWGLTLAQVTADAAAGVVKAIPNIPLMVFAGIQGALGIAAVVAAQPQKPKFETGGIVLGPPGVDAVDARLTSGEMVLNGDQQANLFDMIQRGGGAPAGPTHISITAYFDESVIWEKVITATRDGRAVVSRKGLVD